MKVVYQLRNRRNGRTYIGSSGNLPHRLKQWKDWRNCCTNPVLFADFEADGFDGFEVSILKKLPDSAERKELEREEYNCIHALLPFYNTIGKPRPADVRRKLSLANTGKRASVETKARRHATIMERHKSIPQTNEGHRKLYFIEDMDLLCIGTKAVCNVIGCQYASLRRMFKAGRKTVKGHRISYFSVETNGDECSRVGQRLSYCSKCATVNKPAEEIVHFGTMAKSRADDQGLIDLCYRSAEVTTIRAVIIHEKDEYEYEEGLDPILKHKPYRGADAGRPIAYYAVFKTKSGATGFAFMWYEQVLAHAKQYSKTYDEKQDRFYGPWDTDFDSMAKKTVLIQALKYAPKKSEFARQILTDSTTKSDFSKDMTEVPNDDYIDVPPDQPAEQPAEDAAATPPAEGDKSDDGEINLADVK